jgi:GDP-L-fucose synthase
VSINKNQKMYIAGHRGMVGGAIWNALKKNYSILLGKTSSELDQKNKKKFKPFLKQKNQKL